MRACDDFGGTKRSAARESRVYTYIARSLEGVIKKEETPPGVNEYYNACN